MSGITASWVNLWCAGSYTASRVVLTPGGWAGPMLEELMGVKVKLQVIKTVVNYFRYASVVHCGCASSRYNAMTVRHSSLHLSTLCTVDLSWASSRQDETG